MRTNCRKPAFAPEHPASTSRSPAIDVRSSEMVRRVVRYEEIIIDTNYKRFQRRFRGFAGALFNTSSPARRSPDASCRRPPKTSCSRSTTRSTWQTRPTRSPFSRTTRPFAADAGIVPQRGQRARISSNRRSPRTRRWPTQLHVIPELREGGMSDLGTYSFLPWLRQGLANQIQSPDFDTTVKVRAPYRRHARRRAATSSGGGTQTRRRSTLRSRSSARATSSASSGAPSCAPSRATGSRISSRTTSPTSSSTTKISLALHARRARRAKGRLRPWMTLDRA